ncbi:MAG: pirin family protein [Rhodoblastus sp.]|nr:MAG: pirin family protein [Rhodoblastus sp.]
MSELSNGVEQVIVARTSDIGGLSVRRALPVAGRRMVGPFIFLDEMGPAVFAPGEGLDVRPHPHIGLSTVTYLFDGAIAHRDSTGTTQIVRPGALNIMTAGRGVVHSERSPAEERGGGGRLHGAQLWMALRAVEECAPGFLHFPVRALPRVVAEGKRVRLVLGEAYGEASPVETPTDCVFAEISMAPGATLPVDPDWDERALYVVSGEIDVAGVTFGAGKLLALAPGDRISALALSNARLLLIGGPAMDGPRHIWWNFVSSSKERIEAAKADWRAGKMALPEGESEFIPAPEG